MSIYDIHMNLPSLPPIRTRATSTMQMQFHTTFPGMTSPPLVRPKPEGAVRVVANPVKTIVQRSEFKNTGMVWGPAVWYLYHTLAYKIRAESFLTLRDSLLNFIRGIASILPCPKCSEHATAYMNKINFAAIQTKEQLKLFLYNFHNTVNERKEYPIMLPEIADEKYKTANTVAIIRNFIMVFQMKHNNVRLITDQMHREGLVTKLTAWLQTNIVYFEP